MTLARVSKVGAVVLALTVFGVVVFGIWRGGGSGGSGTQQGGAPLPDRVDDPFSGVLGAGGDEPSGDATDDGDGTAALIGDLGETSYTAVDPDTGLVRFQIRWSALDLLGDGRYRVTDPVARFYEPDRTVVVQSDDADIVWPARDQMPESGELTNRVSVRVYTGDDRPTAENPAPTKLPTPAALLETEALNFQAALGQIDTSAAVRATFPGVRFEGIGLTLRVSETRGRLQFLRVEEHLTTTIRPEALASSEGLFGGVGRGGASGSGAEDEAGDSVEQIDLYQVELAGDFELARGPQRVAAGGMTLWARLRDLGLDVSAISPLDGLFPSEPLSNGQERGGEPRAADAGGRNSVVASDPIVLTGRTPIVIAPVDAAPQDRLELDDVAASLVSSDTSAVTVSDTRSRFTLTASRLNYWATRRRFEARPTGSVVGIEVAAARPDGTRFALTARTLLADLTTGRVELPGGGSASVTAQSGAQRAVVSSLGWSDRLTVELVPYEESSASGLGTAVRSLKAEGSVTALSPELEAAADALRVAFEPVASGGRMASMLRGVRLDASSSDRASVILRDAAGGGASGGGVVDAGAVAARTIEVAFIPSDMDEPASRPVPAQATATSAITASTPDGSLRAESLTSTFGQDDDGRVVLRDLSAQVRVEVRTPDGVRLTGDTVRYREGTGMLTAAGGPAELAYFVDGDGAAVDGSEADGLAVAASVSGPEIRLDRFGRSMVVFGPGRAAFAERDTKALGFSTIGASFERELVFDDARGLLALDGAARVSSFATDSTRTDLVAASIEAELVSGLLDSENRAALDASPAAAVRRVLLRGDAEAQALARLRRYDPGTGELVTAAELVGASISADSRFSRVFVPSAGRLRLLDLSGDDRRPVAQAGPVDPDDQPAIAFAGKGAATLTWEGSFDLDGRTDIITLTNGTTVRYQDPRAATPTRVECQSLAIFLDRPEAPPPGAAGGDLIGPVLIDRINAVGAVFAEHQDRQIIADSLTYQRVLNAVTANAARGNKVTVTERSSATVLNARSITVDLETNELEGVGIETVTVPR